MNHLRHSAAPKWRTGRFSEAGFSIAQVTSVISTLLECTSRKPILFTLQKKSLVDKPNPEKFPPKREHAIERETPQQSLREPTRRPQGGLLKITHHCLELCSVVQSDTPQHISCHTQPIFQQQPINTKKKPNQNTHVCWSISPLQNGNALQSTGHRTQRSNRETEAPNGSVAYWLVKPGEDCGVSAHQASPLSAVHLGIPLQKKKVCLNCDSF